MKKGLHPDNYRTVVFEDLNTGDQFLNKSTAKTKDTVKYKDGKEYPVVHVHISSASHPFYTGEEKIVDVEGRVDRFKSQQEAAKKRGDARANKAKKAAKAAQAKDTDADEVQKIGGGNVRNSQPKTAKKPLVEKKPTDTESKETPKNTDSKSEA